MPPKQPSYLELMQSLGDMAQDPSFFVPMGGAAIVGGIDQTRQALLNRGAAKLGGSVVDRGVRAPRPQFRTGLPFIDDAVAGAKATYDTVVPRFMNRHIEPIAGPVRAAAKPLTNAVASAVNSPVGKAIGTGAKAIGKGVKFIDKTLYSGAGGKAHRILDALTLSSPAGDPYYEDAAIKQGQSIDGILRGYRGLTTPEMMGSAMQTPEGQRKFRLGLYNLHQNLVNAGVPPQVYDHVMASVQNPGKMQNSDFDSLKTILMKHVPLNQQIDDPTFRGGGGVSAADLINTLTFNLPETFATVTGNPNLQGWKTSTQRGIEGVSRFGQIKKQSMLGDINTGVQRKTAELTDMVKQGKMTKEQAQKQLNAFVSGQQSRYDRDAALLAQKYGF